MPETRRDFIRLSGLALLGATVACGSNGKRSNPSGGTIDDVIGDRTQNTQFISVGTELLSGTEERLGFGIANESGLVAGATGEIWIARDREEEALGPFEITYHGDGLPQDRGYYEARVNFPEDGQWLVLVDASVDGSQILAAGTVQVGVKNRMPKPGDKAIRTETPTKKKPRGVDPICTAVPPCGMHETSLADALDAGKPVVLIIATPAFCTSRLCGPEVQLLDGLRGEAPEGTVFVHVEVLANDDPDTVRIFSPLAPAAQAWNLEEEPATYVIDAEGVIVERLLGPADAAAFSTAISRLATA